MFNPFGAIKQGLLAAGRNFDRNAAGDLPQIMGSDFNPDVRRRARANAIMSIGQSLAGQKPLAEGLRGGQESMLQGWAAKQQIMQQRKAQEAAAAAQGMLGQDPGSAGIPTPEYLFSKAQRYEQAAQMSMRAGQLDNAKAYFVEAQNLRQRAAEMMPKNAGAPQTYMGPNGKPTLMQPMTVGGPRPVEGGYGPMPSYMSVDTGGAVQLVDKNNPQATTFPKTMTPGEQATDKRGQADLDWRNWVFNQEFPLRQQATRAQVMSANAAARNAGTNAAREEREAKTAGMGRPLSGDASKVLSIATSMQPEIDALIQAFEEGGRSAIFAVKSGTSPELVRLVESVADKVGRLRSGGAINKDEESRFMGQIVRWADTVSGGSSAAVNALKRLKEEAKMVEQGIAPGRGTQPPAIPPAVPNMPNITITPRAQ